MSDSLSRSYVRSLVLGLAAAVGATGLILYLTMKKRNDADHSDLETLEIFVPRRVVGRIIGKGGAVVREIERVSKCRVVVQRELGGSDHKENKVVLTGASGEIEMAKQLIDDIVNEKLEADLLPVKNIFDTHCHIDFILDKKVRNPGLRTYSTLVERFPAMHHEKLEGFITNYCDPATWPVPRTAPPAMLASAWAGQRLSVHYTVGCHPHFAEQLLVEGVMERMERLLVEGMGRGCVAVGECGLDCSRKNGVDIAIQVEAFKLQVCLALKLSLPIVLHIRDAEREGIQVLQSCCLPPTWPTHRHCWNDTWERCSTWLELFPGSVVGITGLVTYRQADQCREVARLLPLDRLVLETDAPYFRPQYSGVLPSDNICFCHPVQVASVAAQIAKVRGIGLEEVLSVCRENVARVYRIPVPGDRRESEFVVENICEDIILSVTSCDDVQKVKKDICELKRVSDMEGGGDSKKLRTVLDHLATQQLNCHAVPFTPGGSCHALMSVVEDAKPVEVAEELAASEQEEFSLRMIGYDVPCEVYVSAVVSPGDFWVQKIGDMSVELEQLTRKMTQYYSDEKVQDDHAVASVLPGDLVVILHAGENRFFRARVEGFQESLVDLHYVDHGDSDQKPLNQIYVISSEFKNLKYQAIQCSLAHVRPYPGQDWSEAACDEFELLTACSRWKVLWAKVVGYKPGGMPCLEIVERVDDGQSFGHWLVKQRFAVWQEEMD